MKKIEKILVLLLITSLLAGFRFFSNDKDDFNINSLYNYQKEYECEQIEPCSYSSIKTYMDYEMVNDPSSNQYWFIKDNLKVDDTGLLYDTDGFIAVALGSYFGGIGQRYYITLDSGVVLPVVKADEKDDRHVYNGCYHRNDGSVIEFVIDTDKAADYFGVYSNGYILQGNFDNYDLFSGKIVDVERVLDSKIDDYISFSNGKLETQKYNIFHYASGY